MRFRAGAAFLAGILIGGAAVYAFVVVRGQLTLPTGICYSCFWRPQTPALRAQLVDFYQQYESSDALVMSDVGYIVWRAADLPNCDVREEYRDIGRRDDDPYRRFLAQSFYAFSATECRRDPSGAFGESANLARATGLAVEAGLLDKLGRKELTPEFGDVQITHALRVPPNPKTLILGATKIVIGKDTRLGTQVDRVARDWLSYQLKWNMKAGPAQPDTLVPYHEGAFVSTIIRAAGTSVYPLSGTLVARKFNRWYAPDEKGVFRFEVLDDKMQYPTTHVSGRFGIIEDTHGVSALVSQALQRGMEVLVACGDFEGKAKAAYYLAQRGVSVIMPSDRFIDRLIGYDGPGTLIGTSPIRKVGETAVVGGQPVAFSTGETIVVQDTRKTFRLQYYDTPARYFRRLSALSPLKLEFVLVDEENQIDRVLTRAGHLDATAVGVRVLTEDEYKKLRAWLQGSSERRAVLFHSGLYPYAQPLFVEFPTQVTFGDLRPRFQ